MIHLVLIPILMGIIALLWTLFFWVIQVKSTQIHWSIGIASFCALVTGAVLMIWAPSNALALIIIAMVGIMPICKTIEERDVRAALQPLPYSFIIYTVLMLSAYTLSVRTLNASP